jgi:hypothetical protein
MQHLQMSGVRNQLAARGMAIRMADGNFEVRHHDRRISKEVVTFPCLESAYYGGLKHDAQVRKQRTSH